MEITRELVERIAHLARLTLSDEEKTRMSAQIEDILGSMTALDRLTLEQDEEQAVQSSVLRPDEVKQSVERAELLEIAPTADGEYILVPDAVQEGRG